MSAWELTNITARLLLPPGLFIVLGLVGLAFMRSRMRFGTALAAFSLVGLYLVSIPIVSGYLLASLQTPYSDPARTAGPEAIVILGGGSYFNAPEYDGDTVGIATLARVRYGAYLQRKTGKPILVSGGNPVGGRTSEGEQMKSALKEFGANVKWVESSSNNTFDNARMTRQVLNKAGIQSAYLVTDAWHMPRARMAFERAGLHVVPAPMAYEGPPPLRPIAFVPSSDAIFDSYKFFHEILGMLWYRLRFDLGR